MLQPRRTAEETYRVKVQWRSARTATEKRVFKNQTSASRTGSRRAKSTGTPEGGFSDLSGSELARREKGEPVR